jgi:hypothetical protein
MMELKWPDMVEARQDEIYRTAGQRVHWPEYHLSVAVPPSCSLEAGQIYCAVSTEPARFVLPLSLHKTSDWLVSGWLDEAWDESGEQLRPTAPTQTVLDAEFRSFASTSYTGYKITVNDEFRNGASAKTTGPTIRTRALWRFVTRVADSIRFVHLEALTEEQVIAIATAFFNVGASTGSELFLYIDRHFHVMRNDVMEVVQAVSSQMEVEGHPGVQRSKSRWEVLQQARQIADKGDWGRTIADLRKARR